MSRIVLTGDSHLGALKNAQDLEQNPQFAKLDFMPLGHGHVSLLDFFQIEDSGKCVKVVHPEWNNIEFSEKTLNKNGDFQLLVVSLPINSSRLLREHSWHRHVPWRLKNKSKEIPLSDALVETIIKQDCDKSIDFVNAIAQAGIKVAALEGPRFFDHVPFLKKKRIDVCADIERRCRAYATQRLADCNVDVITQPGDTITAAGTTHPDFRHPNPKDKQHGNAAYGVLTCNAIMDYAENLG